MLIDKMGKRTLRERFLAATIEPECLQMRHTKYVFRLHRGVYLVHPDLFRNKKVGSL